MPEVKIDATARSEFGKGAARRARRDGRVPAVLYGHGTDPLHISLPGREIQLAMRAANTLLSISIDGGRPHLALPKQVQRNPVKGSIEHLDLVIVRKGEKVTVEVPLVVVAEDKADRIVVMDQQTITLEVEATNIPAQIDIDATRLEIGDTVTAQDLVLPEGAVFPGEPDDLILSIAPTPSQASLDAELAAAAAAAVEGAGGEAPAAEAAEEA